MPTTPYSNRAQARWRAATRPDGADPVPPKRLISRRANARRGEVVAMRDGEVVGHCPASDLTLEGRPLSGSPRTRIEHGMAFLTEGRRDDGLCMEASIAENITLGAALPP